VCSKLKGEHDTVSPVTYEYSIISVILWNKVTLSYSKIILSVTNAKNA